MSQICLSQGICKCSRRCLVGLQEKPFSFYASELCFHVLSFTFPRFAHVFKPHAFKPRTFKSLFKFYSTFLGLILSTFFTFLTLIPLYQIFVGTILSLSQSCQYNAFWSELVSRSTKIMLVAWSWAAEI